MALAGDLLPQITSAQKPGPHPLTLQMDFLQEVATVEDVMGQMFASSSNSEVEMLTPKVMLLGDWALEGDQVMRVDSS